MTEAATAAPKTKKPRKTKKEKAVRQPKTFDRDAEEAALIKKYPKQKIKEGSLKDVGAVEGFGNKRTIVIFCQATGKERRIATSDLHQVKYSEEHMKELRQSRRKKSPDHKKSRTAATKKAGGSKRGRKPALVVNDHSGSKDSGNGTPAHTHAAHANA